MSSRLGMEKSLREGTRSEAVEGLASNTSYDGNRLGCTVAVECVDTMRQQEVCNYSVRVSNMFSRRDPRIHHGTGYESAISPSTSAYPMSHTSLL